MKKNVEHNRSLHIVPSIISNELMNEHESEKNLSERAFQLLNKEVLLPIG